MSQQPRVPLALKELIFLLCKKKPFCYLGKVLYSIVSKIVASKLCDFSPSIEVFLRGKEASKSIPGLSDLDFWVFLPEAELQSPKKLLELRTLFRKLNKRFILPVKLEVTSRLGWDLSQAISPASFLQDLPLIKFTFSGWIRQETNPRITPRALSRFNLCFFEFKSAQLCLITLTKNTAYRRAAFSKHIKKLIEFADLDLPPINENMLYLQAHALLTLDRLSAIACLEVNNISALQINVAGDTTKYDNPSKNAFLNAFVEFTVEYDCVMDLLIWDIDQPDLKDTEQILTIFKKMPEDKRPQFIVTRRIWQCLWRGFAYGPLLENLDRIPTRLYETNQLLASDLYLHMRDRLVTRINHNLGVLVSYDQPEFLAPLLYQCFEVLIIQTKHLTNDINLLCSIAEYDCPLTVKWIRRLRSENIPTSLQEWSEAFIEVRCEALKILK